MGQNDKMLLNFFCQIIIGSSLNRNVQEGRSMDSCMVSFRNPNFRVVSLQNQTRIYPSNAEIQTENIFLLNQTLYVGCKIASSESEKSNLGQRYDNDNDGIHVSSRRLALCPHTLHWVAFEKNGVDTETVPPFSFWRHVGIKSWFSRQI